MTNDRNPSNMSPENANHHPGGEGTILQRGGEELAIAKVADRFTVNPSSQSALTNLAETLPAQFNQSVAPAKSAEFIVTPAQRDEVMQTARDTAGIQFASHVYEIQGEPGTLVYLTDQITLQFAPQTPASVMESIATSAGLRQVRPVVGIPDTFVYQVTPQATENPLKIANRLMQRSEVLTAEPNIITRSQPSYRPKDALYPQQWHLNNSGGNELSPASHIFAESAWDMTRGNRSIIVAVVDDSFDLNHSDFQGLGKIVAPKDLRDQDLLPLPDANEQSHGTACAGVAIAEENGVGVVGVAPGCAFMPIRTSGFLDDEMIEQAFGWARENGAAVISCSWGPSAVYFPLSLRQRAAMTRAATEGRQGKGCVIVFAAGNANRPVNGTVDEQGWSNNVLKGPTRWLTGFAVHPDAIAVSACTSLNKKAAYSNWGTSISVCAPSNNAPPSTWFQETGFVKTPPQINGYLPGQGILTTDQVGVSGYESGNYTATFGGTSSACPVVAGVAALVLSANPDLTAAMVRQILQQTTDKIIDPDPDLQFGVRYGTYEANGYSQWFGYGRVNAFKAVQAAVQMQTLSTPKASKQLQQRSDTPVSIPDSSPRGTVAMFQVESTGLVQDIQVSVEIEHSFLGDLTVSLIAPTGRTILLQGRTLGRRSLLQTTYSLQTTPQLRQLYNQSAQGLWQLWLIDHAPMDTGTLKSWQLILGI